MGTHILIHLHPDFFHELRDVLRDWNKIQNEIEFIGVRPKHDLEVSLFESGAISDDKASIIADQIRMDSKYPSTNGIIIFTEKRLYDEDYYQLFVGGTESDEEPPNIGIISLQLLRKLYSASSRKTLMFRAIVSNILFCLGIDVGLNDHGDEIKGCIMDFCNSMPDIEKGLMNGPKFCLQCNKFIKNQDRMFLLDLVESFQKTPDLENKDKDITETI